MISEDFEIVDKRFMACVLFNVRAEKLFTGCRWAEGPAWFGGGRYLIWSDIPNDRMLRFDECDGRVSVFRQPSLNSNGNTVDREGRLVSAEHRGRRISRTEHEGRIITLADRWQGKRLNSPNDLVVKSDGSVWFTDPSYGIDWEYEGERAESEIGACHVYRIDPASGEVAVAADDFEKPNGIAFSPDESRLYVVDTGISHREDGPRHIRVFEIDADGRTLRGGEVFASCEAGVFDGLRVDTEGRVWTSTAEGVHCYLPSGDLIGKIRIPEVVANCTFGGAKKNRLFICGTTSLYSIFVNANGAQRP
jgi:gluconolactonase